MPERAEFDAVFLQLTIGFQHDSIVDIAAVGGETWVPKSVVQADIPPSDISRTKPPVRLILNQIGWRLTERLEGQGAGSNRHQLLLMLDEFPALGRSDFFETALISEIEFALMPTAAQ